MTIDPSFWWFYWAVFGGSFTGSALVLCLDRTYNEIVFRRNRKRWEKEEHETIP